jgi:hypothetical protein
MTPTPNFTFMIDGTISVTTNSNGFAQVNNLSLGQHTVSENVPSDWFLQSVAPANGVVNVVAGTQCVKVTFKDTKKEQQQPTAETNRLAHFQTRYAARAIDCSLGQSRLNSS